MTCATARNQDEAKQRTAQQNKALHKYFTMLSEALNDAGYDMKKTLKPSVGIQWTSENIKEYLWKPIQEAIINEASTTELTTEDVSTVYQTLDKYLQEKLGVSVAFPDRFHRSE